MNHWAGMLRNLPASWQRLIARANRISLPRGAGADVRLDRLRQSLCHAATVRATYHTLEPAAQAALQELRACRGGLRADLLQQRLGPIRSCRQLTADPHPRNVAERLALPGWLLYRPASSRSPARHVAASRADRVGVCQPTCSLRVL